MATKTLSVRMIELRAEAVAASKGLLDIAGQPLKTSHYYSIGLKMLSPDSEIAVQNSREATTVLRGLKMMAAGANKC